jgi:hypothetical protein
MVQNESKMLSNSELVHPSSIVRPSFLHPSSILGYRKHGGRPKRPCCSYVTKSRGNSRPLSSIVSFKDEEARPTGIKLSAYFANLLVVILLMLLISKLFQSKSKSTSTIKIQAGLPNLTAVERACLRALPKGST